jgi:hypothetical protein
MRQLFLVVLLTASCLAPAFGATFVVTNTLNDGPGSLRQAITDANTTAELDTIAFNILPGGAQTIIALFDLPVVTSPAVIDGWTQPGFAGQPLIELSSGANALYGLQFQSHSNVVRGLVINRFLGNGITLQSGSSANRLEGNWIGTDIIGKLKNGNATGVEIVGGTNNVVGGPNPASRNLISGNSYNGIAIRSSGNTVHGNYIGTDVDGTNAIGNGYTTSGVGNVAAGVWLEGSAARGNLIISNLISGNTRGVALYNSARTNMVWGNIIGPIAGGTAPMPGALKQHWGVEIFGSDGNRIGSTDSPTRNVISGNGDITQGIGGNGISINSSFGNIVQGNYIGTDVSGTARLGNVRDAVTCSSGGNNIIGGTTAGARNIISGNGGSGISFIRASSNVVQGNYIGTKTDGASGLGNANAGIFIYNGDGHSIGGTTAASGNVIAWNGYSNATHGIFISEESGTSRGNLIRRNSFFSNAQYGIRLFNINCFTCDPFNDAGDSDNGPNTLLNFPVITNATTSGGSIAISGTYNSTPNAAFTLEFFASPEIDPSGFGEGKIYIGSAAVVTDVAGNASFNSFFVDAGYTGQFITATATDGAKNTSEFSAAAAADGPGGVLQFGQAAYSVGESGGFMTVDVVRLGGNSGTVTVRYATSDGTAVTGIDYIAVSGTITFANGEVSRSFSIPIFDDAANEPNETVFIILDTPTGGAVLGPRTNAVLTITDNDPIYVSVDDAAVTKPASGSVPMLFPVYLSAASSRTVSVAYATANISAEAGIDYLTATGRLDFIPGVLTQYVAVTVLTDGLQEGAKSFLLNLSSPAQVILADSTGLGTIYDGTQGVLQFSSATYTAAEGAGTATITITRTGGTLGTVSVPFSATTGTATAGSDFVATNGVLTFNNGINSRTFSVPLLDDSAVEGNETIQLSLSTPTGTTLGTPSSAVLTIADNDTPPTLFIRATPNGVALSWPTQANGFGLVSSLIIPTTNWVPVTNTPFLEGTRFVVTNSTTSSNRFYRLRQ